MCAGRDEMSLTQEIQEKDLKQLMKAYSATLDHDEPEPLVLQQSQLLTHIFGLAAEEDISLVRQAPTIIRSVFKQVKAVPPHTDLHVASQEIYGTVVKELNQQTDVNRKGHKAQGKFDQVGLHRRRPSDQMQDHDMTQVMPSSHGNIEVLAVLNQHDRSTDLVREAVLAAIQNPKIKHVVIPIGPGHWRGMYLTKPAVGQTQYQLELFDPYGPKGASAIRSLTLGLLKKCGIKEEQVTIKFTGPTHPQKDVYACGDFTCAHSHKKMKDFGAPEANYNKALITALEQRGNDRGSLRHATCIATAAFEQAKLRQSVVNRPTVEKTKISQPVQLAPIMSQELQAQLVERIETPEEIIEKTLDPQEKKVFEATSNVQKAVVMDQSEGTRINYKQELACLIKSRNSIFDKADSAAKKEGKAEHLDDEELAAKLQAQEFISAGLQRR